MSLQFKVEDKTEIPKGLESHYVERDGAYFLDVSDMVEKSRLDEFRTNNIKLSKAKDEIEAKFKKLQPFSGLDDATIDMLAGINPDEYKNMKSMIDRIDASKLIDEGKIDQLLSERMARLSKDHESQVKKMSDELSKRGQTINDLNSRLSTILIDSQIQSAAGKMDGIKSDVMDIVVMMGRQIFRMNESGEIEARDAKGEKIYGKDGAETMTIDEWVSKLPIERPSLFESSQGAGSSGGNNKTGNFTQADRAKLAKMSPNERLKHVFK